MNSRQFGSTWAMHNIIRSNFIPHEGLIPLFSFSLYLSIEEGGLYKCKAIDG